MILKIGGRKSRLAGGGGGLLFADAGVPFERFDASLVLDDVSFEVRGSFFKRFEDVHDFLMLRVYFSVEPSNALVEVTYALVDTCKLFVHLLEASRGRAGEVDGAG